MRLCWAGKEEKKGKQTRDPEEEAEEDVQTELAAASGLEEDGEERKEDGQDHETEITRMPTHLCVVCLFVFGVLSAARELVRGRRRMKKLGTKQRE